MNKYSIKRVNCIEGIVEAINMDGKKDLVTDLMSYDRCMEYVKQHQIEIRVYKIGKYSYRKNAVRHFAGCIYADSPEAAKSYFHDKYDLEVQLSENSYRLELCTGDWKVIDQIDKE